MSDKINRELAALFNKGRKANDKILAQVEAQIIEQYKIALETVRRDIADLFARYGEDLTFEQAVKFSRLSNLEKKITGELSRLGAAVKVRISGGIREAYSTAYYYSAFALEATLQQSLGFGVLSNDKIEAALLNPVDRIKWPSRLQAHIEALNRRVRQAIAQGLIQGSGLSKVARDVRDSIGRDAYQALRIIRTESQRAQSAARLLAIEQVEQKSGEQGFTVYRVWLATLDGRTRESHRRLDGQRADEDGYFYFDDESRTTAPGMSGIAEEDIHCRCTIISEFEGVPLQWRRDNVERKNIPFVTYEDWYKARIDK